MLYRPEQLEIEAKLGVHGHTMYISGPALSGDYGIIYTSNSIDWTNLAGIGIV